MSVANARETLAAVLTDGRRMRSILGLVLAEHGVRGTVRACALHQVRRRISRRTEAGATHWLEVCYALEVIDPDSGAVGREWLTGRVGGDPRADLGVPATRVEGLDLLLWRLPDDPGLPRLRAFLDARLAGTLFGAEVEHVDVVRYEPGEHCTARFSGADGRVRYGKLYADEAGWRRALHTQQALARAGQADAAAFRVAAPAAVDALRASFSDEQRGVPLADRLHEEALQRRLADAAALLRATAIDDLPLQSPAHWLALARKWRKKMVMAGIADAGRLDALLARLHDEQPAIVPVTMHGDFHVDQLLVGDDGRLVLFDFDNASRGSGCQDLADFLTQWRLRQPSPPVRAGAADLLAPLAAAWEARAGALSAAELDWYLRLMFVRKAYSFFVHYTTGARERVAAALEAAEAGLRPLPLMAAAPMLTAAPWMATLCGGIL